MTKQEILSALETAIGTTLAEIPIDETLSSADNTTITDALAGVLETVNPNHNYPPTPR